MTRRWQLCGGNVVRVVLDTVVFVRALINARSFAGRILSEFAPRYVLLVSTETAQELLEVIRRPELAAKYKKLQAIRIEAVIELVAQAERVQLAAIPQVVRDAKDDIFVATAQMGNADYLVTEDKDLLDLEHEFNFEIINLKTFIEILEAEAR
ncbi:putative toxin-antitoxin system toxin component, PIN family [Anaerolineae bacterium CFX7]|nr:putative toxin-antitoxin system toxin component, PIN family [Anaerolineae bacterium CFX7]